jgi:hypothetical protein
MITVVNNNDFTLSDRFNGENYEFKPKDKVKVAEVVATHIFGYGVKEKLPFLVRLGWAVNSGEIKPAYDKLNKFVFYEEGKEPQDQKPVMQKK